MDTPHIIACIFYQLLIISLILLEIMLLTMIVIGYWKRWKVKHKNNK